MFLPQSTQWQWPLSGVHSIMLVKSAQAGEDGGCTPSPFYSTYTITSKFAVSAPAECKADTLQYPYFSSTPIFTLWFSQDRHISKSHVPKTQKWISKRTLNQQCQQSRLASPSFFCTFLCLCSNALCLSPILYLFLSPHSFFTIVFPLLSFNISFLYTVLSLCSISLNILFLISVSSNICTIPTMHCKYFVVKNISSDTLLCSPGSSVGRALGF